MTDSVIVDSIHMTLRVSDPSRLNNPLELEAEKTESGYWLITHPQIMTHGTGETPESAAKDFLDMLEDLFHELVESEVVLAPNLEKDLNYLKTILKQSPSK